MLGMFLARVVGESPRSESLAKTVLRREVSQVLGRPSVTLFMLILWLMRWAINSVEITHSMATVVVVREGTATAALRMSREAVQPSWDTREFVEMTIFKVTAMPFFIPRVLTKFVQR